jgi:hypothetical protein
MPCHDCLAGPEGIGGHAHLLAHEQGSDLTVPVFKCAECGERFDRLHAGGSVFIWSRLPETPGK